MSDAQSNDRRIVHLADGSLTPRSAKMTTGVLRYSEFESVAIVDREHAGKTAGEVLGTGGETPIVATLEEALQFSPNTLLIGVTPVGGRVPPEWRQLLLGALKKGLDIWAGMHDFLTDDEEFAAAAKRSGVKIRDLRKPAKDLPVGAARCREAKSFICHTVGTDCALGKMTVSLELDRVAKARGFSSEFIATGQTGIAISGKGSPIDAIPGDFMAGAVERDILSVDGADFVWVEGQGSLLHPGFSSVTLGLLHGACADALILCHDISRPTLSRLDYIKIPPLKEVADLYLRMAAPVYPTKIAGVALRTADFSEAEARDAVKRAEDELQVPASDVIRFGAEPLFEGVEKLRRDV